MRVAVLAVARRIVLLIWRGRVAWSVEERSRNAPYLRGRSLTSARADADLRRNHAHPPETCRARLVFTPSHHHNKTLRASLLISSPVRRANPYCSGTLLRRSLHGTSSKEQSVGVWLAAWMSNRGGGMDLAACGRPGSVWTGRGAPNLRRLKRTRSSPHSALDRRMGVLLLARTLSRA